MKRPARVPSQLSESLHKRLSANTLAASAAGVSLLALAHPADAKIVYTPANLNIPPGAVPLDLNHDGVADFSLVYSGHTGTTSNGAFFERSLRATPVVSRNGVRGYRNFASALPAGVRIGPKGHFLPSASGTMALYYLRDHSTGKTSRFYHGPWANNGKGVKKRYLGLKFMIHGQVHFGWARLNVAMKGSKIRGTLTGYAYETIPNKPIIAGKTRGKNEATLGQLAQGASGVSNGGKQ